MSVKVGKLTVHAIAHTPAALDVVGDGSTLNVYASAGRVELLAMPCNMTRAQAERLRKLLSRAIARARELEGGS